MQIDTFTATTIDNIIAPEDNTFFVNNSSSTLLQFREKIRQKYDAILVGANTIKKDNPTLLNKRNFNYRVIIDLCQSFTFEEKIFLVSPERTILLTPIKFKHTEYTKNLFLKGVNVIFFDNSKGLENAIVDLKKYNISNLLVEGGGRTINCFLNAGLINSIQIVLFPNVEIKGTRLFDSLNFKHRLSVSQIKVIDDSYIFIEYLIKNKNPKSINCLVNNKGNDKVIL